MHVLLKHPDFPLLSIMKRTDFDFPTMIRKGYLVIFEGFRWQAEKEQERLMLEAVADMDSFVLFMDVDSAPI